MGTQKNHLNEMVLLSTQNIYVKTDRSEDIRNFTVKNVLTTYDINHCLALIFVFVFQYVVVMGYTVHVQDIPC